MHNLLASCLVVAFSGIASFAGESEDDNQGTPGESPSSVFAQSSGPPIRVKLSGPLQLACSMKADADYHDMSARELTDADLIAGGTIIHLDWNRSFRIRNELLWWTEPRAGDARGPYAEVTGQMVFKPLRDLDQKSKAIPHGVSADTPVPVVTVETIKVQLAMPDGKISGPQPARDLVVAEERTTEPWRPLERR